MQDEKMTDQVARHENTEHEIVTYFSGIVISDRMFSSLLNANCFDELFFFASRVYIVSDVVYTSDIVLNYLRSNCFDKLFFALYCF